MGMGERIGFNILDLQVLDRMQALSKVCTIINSFGGDNLLCTRKNESD